MRRICPDLCYTDPVVKSTSRIMSTSASTDTESHGAGACTSTRASNHPVCLAETGDDSEGNRRAASQFYPDGSALQGPQDRPDPAVDPKLQLALDSVCSACANVGTDHTCKTTSKKGKRKARAEGEKHVPRPMNAFMIWAREERQTLAEANPKMHNAQISKQLGQRWESVDPEAKAVYQLWAKKVKIKHQSLYPNYKYRPQKKAKQPAPSALSPAAKSPKVLSAAKSPKALSAAKAPKPSLVGKRPKMSSVAARTKPSSAVQSPKPSSGRSRPTNRSGKAVTPARRTRRPPTATPTVPEPLDEAALIRQRGLSYYLSAPAPTPRSASPNSHLYNDDFEDKVVDDMEEEEEVEEEEEEEGSSDERDSDASPSTPQSDQDMQRTAASIPAGRDKKIWAWADGSGPGPGPAKSKLSLNLSPAVSEPVPWMTTPPEETSSLLSTLSALYPVTQEVFVGLSFASPSQRPPHALAYAGILLSEMDDSRTVNDGIGPGNDFNYNTLDELPLALDFDYACQPWSDLDDLSYPCSC